MSAPHPAFELERFSVLANSPAVLTKPELAGVDPLTRRVGCFMVFDDQGRSQAFRDDSAPRLRPDFLISADPEGQFPLLNLRPVEPGRYELRGAQGALIGRFSAHSRALLARRWLLEEASGGRSAWLDDTDRSASLTRRWRPARARDSFLLTPRGGRPAYLLREAQPLPYLLRVVSPPEFGLDRRLLLAAALCVPALEGLTDYLSGAR